MPHISPLHALITLRKLLDHAKLVVDVLHKLEAPIEMTRDVSWGKGWREIRANIVVFKKTDDEKYRIKTTMKNRIFRAKASNHECAI